jgi:antitoxin component HigA of HigAB toxin-antitoxin module
MKLKTFKYSIESLEQQYDKAIEEINKTLEKDDFEISYIDVVNVEFLNSEIAVIKYKIKWTMNDDFEDKDEKLNW